VRLSYWNPAKAVDVLNNQQRVSFTYDKGTVTPGDPNPAVVKATVAAFTLQLPASELTADPNLAEPPVPYY
jgi:hypothetical protein